LKSNRQLNSPAQYRLPELKARYVKTTHFTRLFGKVENHMPPQQASVTVGARHKILPETAFANFSKPKVSAPEQPSVHLCAAY